MNEKPGHLLIEKSNVNSSPSSSSKTCRPLKVIYSDTAYIGNDLTANGQKESKTTVNLCEQPQKRYSNGAHNSSNSHTQRPAVSTISSSHSSVAGHHHHHHLHHHSPQLQTSVNNNNSFSSSASSSAASPPAPLNSSNISNSSSSHTSSNSNSGGGGVNSTPARHANSNGYSELLRYRSQEFYTKVHYPNGSANSTNSTSSNGSCNGKQESPSSLLSQPSQTDQAYSNALSSPSSSSASTSHAHQQQQPPLQQSHSNGTSPSLAYHRNHHSHHHHNPNLQHHHSTNHLAAKELSLNDLSHPSLYNSIDQHSTTSSGAPTSSATAAQILQSRLAAANQQQRYYPHHPHYSNHLYSAGALSGALSGSSSLVRSNSSLSLSYHQYQKKYSKLLNGNYHHHQPHQPHHPLVPSHQILSQVSANPSVTLSTHNLFSDSGYCSAYSGSIASGTLDSRHSKISTESSNSFLSYSQQLAQHHQVQQQLQHQLNSFEQQQNALAFGGGVSSVKQPQQQQFTSVEPSPSPNSSTSNYYSSSLSLSAPPASASSSKTAGTHSSPGRQRLPGAPNLMVSTTRSPSHSAGTSAAQNVRPYLGSAMSASSSSTTTTTSTTTGRATLTRSSSSGPAVVGGDASLSVAPNHHYGQILNSSVVGGSAYALNTAASSRPASLVTVLADGNVQQQQQATYASPSHHNHQQQHHQHHLQQQQYGTSQQFGGQGSNVVHGNYHHLYGSTTGAKAQSTAVAGAYHKVASNGIVPSVSSSSNNNYGLPQRFPTTITQTKSPSMVKLVSTTTAGTGTAAAALAAPPPSIMSSSYHSHYSTGMGPNSGQAATSSAALQNSSSTGNSSVSSSTSMAVGSGNQSSFPRSLFNTSSNIFESKKNKLFGSVSSIDLQCLKESQKVSVIERKSSRIGRSLKSTSNSSNTSTTTIAPTTISTTVVSATSASSNGSSGSTTSSFFRLFTSGSSKKMIPFSFSGSGSASSSHQQQQQLSPPTPGSAVPSASVNHYSGSGSASSASSSSSTHTITARSGSDGVVLNGDQQQQQQHGRRTVTQQSEPINGKPIKSNSLDSAANTVASVSGITSLSLSTANMTVSAVSSSVSAQQLTNTILELTLPANEVLFRRYFTFFDLMSSLNHQRLFEASPPPSSSTSSSTSSGFSSGTINSTGSSATSSSSIIQQESYQSHQQRITNNGQSVCVVTTFESSTLSSTSSYSSCTSSLSSASHPTQQYSSSQYGYNKSAMSTSVTSATSNGNHMASSSCNNSVAAAAAAVVVPSDVGNDLLSPSLNFLNEIGSERQYSIELKWNNGSKEEIPAEMLDEKKHNADRSIYDTVNSALNGSQGVNSGDSKSTSASTATANSTSQLHPPLLARCLNIFSDASPFTNPGHSVMSDLFGAGSLTVGSGASKSIVTDFGSDDGFVSLSSTSHHGCGSTYPNGGGGNGNGCASPTENSRCPFSTAAEKCNVVEVDYGTNYYRTHFRDSEHQNWLQMHEKYGPIVVSLRKERVKSSSGNGATSSGSSSSSSSSSSASSTRWRVIVRTTSLIPLRGTIAALPSICLPGGSPGSCSLDSSGGSSSSRSKGSANQADQFNINSVKDVLSLVMPKSVCVSNFRLGSPTAVSFLLKLDELSQNTEYKIGVLYAYAAQHSEEEFYNNILDYSTASKGNQFYDFLGLISSRVRLKDYKGYKAGLDVLNDTTGEYSWTARHHSVDIMFHVCTELPFTETNRQQLPRKRHIGNDIVTIVFLKEDFHGPAFSPALIRSKFQQVFIIVKPVNNGQYYRVAVARHRLVPLFGPPLKPCYTRHELKDFILTKIINAENACHSVNKFAEMAKRTRNEYLVDLCSKHTTNQTVHHVDSSSSSMNSLNSFKKLFGSSSSSNSTSGGGSGSVGDQYHHVSSSKRSKHLSANHEFHLVNQDAYLTGGALAPLTGPPFSRSHILNGVKDPPTLLGGIVFNERCAGSSVPSRLYVHDFSTSRDIEASLLLSNEAILVIDAASSEVIWAAPVTSIIGWTDSSGVFATSPTTSPVIEHHSEKMVNGSGGSGSGHANHRLGALRAKSMDCEPSSASSSAMHSSATTCRIFRLYYHHGECIEIKQRPTGAPALPAILEPSPSTTAKSARNQAIAASTAHHPSRSDDPFLHLIRILELITRKSELREIVIKRKTSPVHKSSNQTPNGQATTASLDLLGRCGGQFGFSMSLSSGIIEEVMDQTLSAYRLSPGCKVVEIAKISFAAMAPEELQELLSASVIICLTFTEFDFARYQPRCSCPSPQALQMQRQKCLMQTPPSEYENLPLAPKIMPSSSSSNYLGPVKSNGTTINVQPGVKTIHITHNANHSNTSTVTLPQSGEQPQQPQQQPQSHQTLMNMSSTSSTSSTYYSPSNSQTQSPSQHYGTYQSTTSSGGGGGQSSSSSLYQAKSASNLSQYNHGVYHGTATSSPHHHQQKQHHHQQSSPTKSIISSGAAMSATSSPANSASVVRSRSSTINNGSATFKDNLIRLITMDDCGLSSPTGSSHSPGHKSTDESVLTVADGHIIVDSSPSTSSTDPHQQHFQSSQTISQLVSNYQHPHYYGTGRAGNALPGHVQVTTSANSAYAAGSNNNNNNSSHIDPYSPYPSSRYSTASSTQYSSLGRSGAIGHLTSTQIQVPQQPSSAAGAPSNALVQQGSTIRASAGGGGVVVENNDCYLLTAQPVRVDSTCSSSTTSSATLATSSNSSRTHHDLQQQHHNHNHNNNMMTGSLDSTSAGSLLGSSISSNTCNSTASSSAAMFNSLLSSSSATSASETIAGIVWPSMHQLGPSDVGGASNVGVEVSSLTDSTLAITDSPPNSLMIHTPLNRAALVGNEIVVTGNEQINGQQKATVVTGPVAEVHLTDEVRKLSLEKDALNDTIVRLREENQRLHQESQNTSQQLRKLTEWFFNTGSSGSASSSSNASANGTPTGGPNTTTIAIQQQHQQQQPPFSNGPNNV